MLSNAPCRSIVIVPQKRKIARWYLLRLGTKLESPCDGISVSFSMYYAVVQGDPFSFLLVTMIEKNASLKKTAVMKKRLPKKECCKCLL